MSLFLILMVAGQQSHTDSWFPLAKATLRQCCIGDALAICQRDEIGGPFSLPVNSNLGGCPDDLIFNFSVFEY